MRQSLQLRLGQHLTMTPQLQQAIRLLQLSSLDLQAEIQTVLDSNLMLERADEGGDEPAPAAEAALEFSAPSTPDAEPVAAAEASRDELPADTSWDDHYDGYDGSTAYSRGDSDEDRDPFETHGGASESLRDHLLWQMRLTPFSETDQIIATAIIDATDESGYLGSPLEEIYGGLKDEFPQIEPEDLEIVLHRLQRFDPPGVCARNAAECLLLQLDALPPATPWLAQARELVRHHLDLLAGRDFNTLMRRMRLTREQLQAVITLIQSLNPHPGTALSDSQAAYVVPDVFVFRHRDQWRVDLNPDCAPRLRINSEYARLVRRADSSADNTYLKNHLQEARWFLKSLKNRHETLLKVARCIVERQRGFFEHGPEHMRPLVLRDIAEAVEMHESTISRVTSQKYMHTPRGIFEFKYFFSSHVATHDGGEASSIAIQAMLKKLIAAENPQKPLSDSKLAEMLDREGIQVARRTVAKYREAMAIPSSTDRKRIG